MPDPAPTRCPRCNGRLVLQSDWFSTHASCLMCGYVHEPARIDSAVAYAETASTDGGQRK